MVIHLGSYSDRVTAIANVLLVRTLLHQVCAVLFHFPENLAVSTAATVLGSQALSHVNLSGIDVENVGAVWTSYIDLVELLLVDGMHPDSRLVLFAWVLFVALWVRARVINWKMRGHATLAVVCETHSTSLVAPEGNILAEGADKLLRHTFSRKANHQFVNGRGDPRRKSR